MHHNNATKLGKINGTEKNIELKALIHAVRSSYNLQIQQPELMDEEGEKIHPFLEWCTPEVDRKTLENSMHLVKLENGLPMR